MVGTYMCGVVGAVYGSSVIKRPLFAKKREFLPSLRFLPLTNLSFDMLIRAMTTSYTREYLPTSPSKQLMNWTILTDPKEAHPPMRVPEW